MTEVLTVDSTKLSRATSGLVSRLDVACRNWGGHKFAISLTARVRQHLSRYVAFARRIAVTVFVLVKMPSVTSRRSRSFTSPPTDSQKFEQPDSDKSALVQSATSTESAAATESATPRNYVAASTWLRTARTMSNALASPFFLWASSSFASAAGWVAKATSTALAYSSIRNTRLGAFSAKLGTKVTAWELKTKKALGLIKPQSDDVATHVVHPDFVAAHAATQAVTERMHPRHAFRSLAALIDVGLVIALLVGTNLLAHFTTTWVSMATVPLSALVMVCIMRRRGIGFRELGLAPESWRKGLKYALFVVSIVIGVIALGVLLPFTREFFLNDRYATMSGALVASVIVIPLVTVIPEELFFRGMLHGTLTRIMATRGVFIVGSVLFGLWHIASSLGLSNSNQGIQAFLGGGILAQVGAVVLAVIATTGAGVVFTWLRQRSDSLIAPIALHWALNGVGALAAAVAWHISFG